MRLKSCGRCKQPFDADSVEEELVEFRTPTFLPDLSPGDSICDDCVRMSTEKENDRSALIVNPVAELTFWRVLRTGGIRRAVNWWATKRCVSVVKATREACMNPEPVEYRSPWWFAIVNKLEWWTRPKKAIAKPAGSPDAANETDSHQETRSRQ